MQFQVPQFIDVAPKIIGPLTLRQFLFLAGAAFPSFLLFFVLQFWVWMILTAIFASVAIALAFGKINGQPLTRIATAAFGFFWGPRIYLWRHAKKTPQIPSIPGGTGTSFSNVLKGLGGSLTAHKSPKEPEPDRTPLRDLSLKMNTWAHPIEKREKSARLFGLIKRKDKFEGLKKTTGERDVARRVDYR